MHVLPSELKIRLPDEELSTRLSDSSMIHHTLIFEFTGLESEDGRFSTAVLAILGVPERTDRKCWMFHERS